MTPPHLNPPRWALIETRPSPDPHHDYVVSYHLPEQDGVRLALTLVPDRLLPLPARLGPWRRAGWEAADRQLEAFAVLAVEDLMNALVPRWVQLVAESAGEIPRRLVIEDAQPGWRDNALLARAGIGA